MKRNITLFLLFLTVSFSFAEEIEIKLISEKNGTAESLYYDTNTETFSLGYGSYVSKIENLEKLKNLTEVSLVGTAFLKDLSFLRQCTELEVLTLYDLHVSDFSFLYSLPKLKVLDIQSVTFSKLFDILKLQKLEYLAMVNCGITSLKDFADHGKNLQYINLSGNKIEEISHIKANDNAVYILSLNPVAKRLFLGSDSYSFLPDEYKRFVR